MAGQSRRTVQLVCCCVLCAVAFALPLTCFGVLTSAIAADLSCSLTEINLYFTCMNCTAVVSCLLGGRFVERAMKPVVLLGGLLMAAAYFLLAAWPSLPTVLLAGVVAGLCYPPCSSVLVPLVIGQWFEERRGMYAGVSFAMVGVSSAIWGPVLGTIVGAAGWRAALVAMATAIAVACVGCSALLRRGPLATTPSERGQYARPGLACGPGEYVTLALACSLGGIMGMLNTQVSSLAAMTGFDAASASAAFSLVALSLCVGKVLLGALADGRGLGLAASFGCTAGCVSFALLLVSLIGLSVPCLLVAAALAGFATCLGTVLPTLFCNAVFPASRRAALVAHGTAFCNLGMAIGAPLISLSFDLTGSYCTACVMLIAAAVLCCALCWVADRRHRASV